jgi:hypothetical protein
MMKSELNDALKIKCPAIAAFLKLTRFVWSAGSRRGYLIAKAEFRKDGPTPGFILAFYAFISTGRSQMWETPILLKVVGHLPLSPDRP